MLRVERYTPNSPRLARLIDALLTVTVQRRRIGRIGPWTEEEGFSFEDKGRKGGTLRLAAVTSRGRETDMQDVPSACRLG